MTLHTGITMVGFVLVVAWIGWIAFVVKVAQASKVMHADTDTDAERDEP